MNEDLIHQLADDHEYSEEFNMLIAEYFIQEICLNKKELIDEYFGYITRITNHAET